MMIPMVKDIKEELEKGKRYHAASKEEKKILDNKLFKENKPTDNSSKDFIDDFVESLGEILKNIKKSISSSQRNLIKKLIKKLSKKNKFLICPEKNLLMKLLKQNISLFLQNN